MRQKERTRFVKLYFRNQDKVMVAIPNIEGMVTDDVLIAVFHRMKFDSEIIYEVDSNEVPPL